MSPLLVPWVLAAASLAIGAGGTLWYRARYESCKASAFEEKAKAEAAVNAAKSADAAMTRALEEKLAPLVRAFQEQSHETQIALAKVPSNPGCAHTPAADAFDRGVRPGRQQAGPGPAGAARP